MLEMQKKRYKEKGKSQSEDERVKRKKQLEMGENGLAVVDGKILHQAP